jgi:surface polysaccharide O-acyltransferase-like enzyme
LAAEKHLQGFDTMRLFAIFAVICIHTSPYNFSAEKYASDTLWAVNFIIDKLCRFAVPYFFIVSGYFFGKSLQKKPPLVVFKQYARRIFSIFVGWTVLYGIITETTLGSIIKNGFPGYVKAFSTDTVGFIGNHPILFLLQGSRLHLWFLPALIIALSIITYCVAAKKEKYVLYICAALYIFGLLAGVYSKSPIGISLHLNVRNGPFFGAIFTAIGWKLSGRNTINFRIALYILLAGMILQLTEAYFLARSFGIQKFDFSLATLPFGLGAFLLVLARPCLGKDSIIERYSSLTLGIYVSHYLIFESLMPIRFWINPLIYDSIISFVVLILSIFSVMILKKYKPTKHLVE